MESWSRDLLVSSDTTIEDEVRSCVSEWKASAVVCPIEDASSKDTVKLSGGAVEPLGNGDCVY
jgi:hypothetical protein